MVKVFCIGFQKTGTVSAGRALAALGYRVCDARYDLIEPVRNGDLDAVRAVADQYDAVRDNPWPLLFRELDRMYPKAKFILTLRDDVIAKRPQVVKAFLQGWQDTIAFMKNNKAKTVEITSKVTDISHSVIERAYDEQIGIFSEDLTFDPEAMTVLKQSFIEMGLLKEIPDDKAMLTTQFLPVKAGK